MAIPPISSIGGIGSNLGVSGTTGPGSGSGGDSFAGLLGNALGKLDASQAQASQGSQDLATGKATDVSGVVMQVERASLELQLASQVRNKLVDAYTELMHMQI
jgi:flagellar hook-basal body complex protein FliE